MPVKVDEEMVADAELTDKHVDGVALEPAVNLSAHQKTRTGNENQNRQKPTSTLLYRHRLNQQNGHSTVTPYKSSQ